MSGIDEAAVHRLADQLFNAIGAGDLDTVRRVMDPEATVWTNFDNRTVDRDRALRTIGWLVEHVAGLRYDVVRREILPGGFVQQHVLVGTAPSGQAVAMPACIVATVADGLVVRMEEYADPSVLVAALGG